MAGALGLLALVVCGILRLEASYPQVSPLAFELDGPGKNVDDPCFWVDPVDPARSLIFSTQKDSGFVEVFNVVTGQFVGTVPGFVRPNNCAVHGNLLITTDRSGGNVKVHRIPDLTLLRTFASDMDEPYGIDVFSAPEGGTHVFVTDGGDESVHVYDLPTGTLLRTFPTGFGGGIEPMVIDDRYERVYVGRGENESIRGIGIFTPGGTKVGEFGEHVFMGDVEGMAIYACGDEGYFVVSDQRISVAEFEIFDRVTLRHLGTFKLADASGDITNATDGIDILQTPLPNAPNGLLAACDGCGDTLPDEMDVIRWEPIAEAMGLNICPDGVAPSCQTVPCVERFIASADAFVQSSLPDRNTGTLSELELEREPPAEIQIVLRVDVPDLTGVEIVDAILRLTVVDAANATGNDGGTLYAAAGGWTENGVTWRTRPALVGGPIGSAGAVDRLDAVDFDVSDVVTEPGSYNFVLATGSADKVRYLAREADLNPPTLLLSVLASSGPTVTVLGPPAGTMIRPDEAVVLSGSATDADEGDLSESILWTSDLDGFLGQGGSVTVSGLRAGPHTITAAVEDASGLSDAESVHVLVNTAPTLSIVAPPNGALLDPGQPVVLEALAADAEDGDLGASVTWSSSVAGPLGGGARLTLPALVAGAHTITAAVTDTSGVGASRSIGVNVNARPTVVIAAPASGTEITPGAALPLSATATDPEDGNLTASITWTSDRAGSLGTGGTITTTLLTASGTHVLTASVTDHSGRSGTATVSVVVNARPVVAITGPASGSEFEPGVAVVLTGTATDAEDGNLGGAIAWQSDRDGALGTGASVTVTTLRSGAHTITATVTDSRGKQGTATLGLVINARPVVAITGPASGSEFEPGAAVVLTGTANDPEDGNLGGAIAWRSDRDGALGTGASVTVTTLRSGAHLITATVTDSRGRQGTATLGLVINARPVVAITGPASGSEFEPGAAVVLTGTANDPEDGNLGGAIAWRSDRDGALGTGASVTVTTLRSGAHLITATVTDSRGRQGTATLGLVINARPVVAITGPASGSEFEPGVAVVLTGTASDAEDGNLGGAIAWRSDRDGALGTGASVTVTTLRSGAHTITATVTDSRGRQGTATSTVVVNGRPTVHITAPHGGAVVTTDELPLLLVGEANDPEEGTISGRISWTSNRDGALGTGASVATLLSVGSHTLSAEATDALGRSGRAEISILVRLPNLPPVVSVVAPADGATVPAGTPLTFTGHALDDDDGDLSAGLAWTSDVAGSLGSGASLTRTLREGRHVITASVADHQGLVGSRQLSVTILPTAPVVTIETPLDGTVVQQGDALTLQGSASDATDGDLSAALLWSSDRDGLLGSGPAVIATLDGTGVHILRAAVIDAGGLEGAAEVEVVVNVRPIVSIVRPGEGAAILAGRAVTLGAVAADVESGNLGSAVVWTSSRDGALGVGGSLVAMLHTEGAHEIRATVTDGAGGQASDSIMVIVRAPTLTLLPVADTYVEQGTSRVLGADQILRADASPVRQMFLRFALPDVAPFGIAAAKLRLTVTADANDTSAVAGTVRAISNHTWAEATTTYATRPAVDGPVLSSGGAATANAAIDFDVRAALTTGGTYDFALVTSSDDAVGYRSREAPSGQPRLVVDLAANMPPVVDIVAPAADAAVVLGTPLAFSAVATDTEDGNLSAQVGWTSSLQGALGNGATVPATLAPGTHVITARVTDRSGLAGSASRTVTVLSPPSVVITAPASGAVLFADALPVSLRGSATDLEDGDLGSGLEWTSSRDGALGVGAQLHVGLSVGAHTITATVADSDDLDGQAAIGLLVRAANQAPVVAIAAPQAGSMVAAGTEVDFAATATDDFDGNLSAQIAWASDRDGALGVGPALRRRLSEGAHVLRATVLDSDGALGAAERALTVLPSPPVVTIAAPADGAVVAEGSSVTFRATATDATDGNLAAGLLWTSDLAGVLGSGAEITTSGLGHGIHRVTATVADSGALVGDAHVAVLVNARPGVHIDAPADGTRLLAGRPVALHALASDPEDGDLTAHIVWTSNLGGPLGSGGTIVVPSLSAGTHVITARVVDAHGAPATHSLTLDVASATRTIGAIADTYVDQGSPNTLFGTQSAIRADAGPDVRQAFVRFAVPDVAPFTIDRALLRLTATSSATDASVSGGTVRTVSNSGWSEATTRYSNRPAVDGPALGAIGAVALNQVVEVDVTAAVHAAGTYGFAVVATNDDAIGYRSREAASGGPVLVLALRHNAAPVVSIVAPASGATVLAGTTMTFRATAFDLEQGDLSGHLTWSSDRQGNVGSGASVSVALGPGVHVVTAAVMDAEGLVGQAQIQVRVDSAPTLGILSPGNGAVFATGEPVRLRATASDAEDGALDHAIVWTSDLDGPLGTGGDLLVPALRSGVHRITASVTDGSGTPASDTVTVVVNATPVVGILAPADGAMVTEGSAVVLVGAATDIEDGNLGTAILWSSDRDGTLGSGAGLTVALSVGTHVVTASVEDALGAVGTAAITVTMLDAPPVVSIIEPADGTILTEGAPLLLLGTATDARDGDVSGSLEWSSSLQGPLGAGAVLTIPGLGAGTHVITARATDHGGHAGTAAVSVTVRPAEMLSFGAVADAFVVQTAPSSRFGGSAHLIVNGSAPTIQAFLRFRVTGTTGQGTRRAVVRLRTDTSASAGSISGGTIHAITDNGWEELLVSYQTRPAIDGPALDTVGAVVPGTVVEFDVSDVVGGDGTYVFAVVGTVNDSVVYRSRESGADGPALLVSSTPTGANQPPAVAITAPADGALVQAGTAVSLRALATDPEDGDLTGGIVWTSDIGGPLGTGGDLVAMALGPGTHRITASVADHAGGTASASVRLIVNARPVVHIVTPGNGASLPAGGAVTLAATASDAEDGDLGAAIVWTSNRDGALGSGGTRSVMLSLGTHVITATAADGRGAAGSATVTVTVTDARPTVQIVAPADGSTVAAGTAVTLLATATDPEDGDLRTLIAWTSDQEGPLGTGSTLTVSNLRVGTHVITAAVLDGSGQLGSATTRLTVLSTVGLTFGTVADAFVVETSPTSRFGASTHLIVNGSGPTIQAFLRFRVTGTMGQGTRRAVVRLRTDTSASAGSVSGGTIHAITDTGWEELLVSYQTRPAIDRPALASVGAVAPGATVEFDVSNAINGDGTYVFAVVGAVNDSVVYRSRESGATAPVLLLDLQ